MNPDPELLRAFGNEDVYADKLAGRADLVARVALGLMGYGSGRAELQRQQALKAEAEAMNSAFEHMQHMKLMEAEGNARHTRPPIIIPAPVPGLQRWDGDAVPIGLDEGMVRLAAVAYDVGSDMAKEALSIQPLVDTAKNIFGKVGPAMSSALGKSGLGNVVGAAAQAPKAPTLAAMGQKITAGLQAAPKPPPAIGQVAPTLAAGAAATGGPATAAASAGKFLGQLPGKIQQGLQQSGVTSLKGAALTAGGLALGGMAMKGAVGGLKKGLDVMSQEAGPQQYGTQQFGGSRIPYGVNEYGQPDLRSPFM